MTSKTESPLEKVPLPTSIEEWDFMMAEIAKLSPHESIPIFRHFCRTDLYFLLRYGCSRLDVARPWLFDRCREVQEEPNEHLDLWSREHYKSTIITFAKSIQDILASHGNDPLPAWEGREVTIGIFSHTRPIARQFLRQIKMEFEGNDLLKEWFPDILWQYPSKESPKWSEDDGLVVKRKTNPKESTVEAWGLTDGQPTSKHFLVLVYDDVVTLTSVSTPDMINKTTNALQLSYNLGDADGHRRFIGTRYHYNDTYRTILNSQTAIPRIYPATKDGTFEGEPVLLTREALEKKRRDQGPYNFACLPAGSPVLMSNWHEKAVEEVKIGDSVIGWRWGEKFGQRRCLTATRVVNTHKRKSEVLELTLSSGKKVYSTAAHGWFTGRKPGGSHREFIEAATINGLIRVVDDIPYYEDLTEEEKYAAAYLGGLYDGEGSFSTGGFGIAQSEKVNPDVFVRMEETLRALNFRYTCGEYEGYKNGVLIKGGRQELVRFLRQCRPGKIDKFSRNILKYGRMNWGRHLNFDPIVERRSIGEQDVYNIQTETGNYVAFGFASSNCQMMQDPRADEHEGFKEEWLKFYHGTIDPGGFNKYILVDPANEKKKTSDYTAMWVIGIGSDQNYYVLDMYRDRLNLQQRADLLFRLHRKYRPLAVGYEKYGMQADIQHIEYRQQNENYRFLVTPLGGTTRKTDRIKRLLPLFRDGRVYLPDTLYKTDYEGRTLDLVDVFIQEEYKPFPVSVHDDMLDALCRIEDPEFTVTWPIGPEVEEDRYASAARRSRENSRSWMSA